VVSGIDDGMFISAPWKQFLERTIDLSTEKLPLLKSGMVPLNEFVCRLSETKEVSDEKLTGIVPWKEFWFKEREDSLFQRLPMLEGITPDR
jgi:hypothetical protein